MRGEALSFDRGRGEALSFDRVRGEALSFGCGVAKAAPAARLATLIP
ncbi:MAG: hypothetical protein KDB72_17855 [Mycobacterium sp.]|nr:hypothetical protein [Mycobacterium sp.]